MNWNNEGPSKPKYVYMWEENEDCDKIWMKVVVIINNSKKVKRSVTGLEWPRGFLEVKVPRFHDNGTGNITPITHFCQRLSRTQGHSATTGLCHSKIPKTSLGIEPATCRLVAQHLNHYATARPNNSKTVKFSLSMP
jgi:hypothetical protein